MDELFRIIKGINKKEWEDKKFAAAIKGIDLEGESGRHSGGNGQMVDIMEHPVGQDENELVFKDGQGKIEFGIGNGLGLTEE